jgi:integrase
VQKCYCKDCGHYFQKSLQKRLSLYINGKLIDTFWEQIILNHLPEVACPNCNEHKAILTSENQDNRLGRKVRRLLCVNCGQKFSGDGRPWKSYIYRLKVFFKEYILERIKQGFKIKTIVLDLDILKTLGKFLQKREIDSFVKVDRILLADYWNQERSHISKRTHRQETGVLKRFFDWLRQEQKLAIPDTLITIFDYPKCFTDDPDPLEDCVLEAIRDNLHILPDSLQLQFMLGFWLGARPCELSKIFKNCVSLAPDGITWWLEFERDKLDDEHRLPITTDLVRLIHKQQQYIENLFGSNYPYLFCHYD